MTILQALKKIKHLDRKIEKNQMRIQKWSSHYSDEEPLYDQRGIEKLIQSTNDLVLERDKLKHLIHKTNIETKIIFKGNEMSLDELIAKRTSTVPSNLITINCLHRKEKNYNQDKAVKVVMQYEPAVRDKVVDIMENILDEMDALLDETNIITELTKE